jgi:hypothetical protein
MAQGAATWDATKMSTLEMSAKGMTKPNSDHWFQKPPFPPEKNCFLFRPARAEKNEILK